MELSAASGLTLAIYIPEPDTPSDQAFQLLASRAATTHEATHPIDQRPS